MTQCAPRVERRILRQGTGLETLVDLTANVFLVVGVLAAGAFLLTLRLWGLGAFLAGVVGAYLQWLLLRCIAEHLRLQKRIAGVEIQGKITGPTEAVAWTCGECGHELYSYDRCDSCGAEIVLKQE